MRKSIFLLSGLLLLSFAVRSQDRTDYRQRTSIIYKNIYQRFYDRSSGLYLETNDKAHNEKPHSFLWPVCALLQAANEMEVTDRSQSYIPQVKRAVDQYRNTNPPAPGYQAYVTREEASDRYYDDNQWIAIAYLDAYNRTHDKIYLDLSKEIYRFMLTGFDNQSGGGLYWREGDKTTKNTCSNGPAILIALQLHKITGEKSYLDTARLLYDWTNKHLQAANGLYYDALKIPSLKIDSALYTYNTGTMLQSNILLYKITGDKKYLQEGKRIADAARSYFYKGNKLPGEYWFNAVLLRGLVELYTVDRDKKYIQYFVDDADRVWKEERDSNNLLGRKATKRLIDQAAMLEIYARLQELKLH